MASPRVCWTFSIEYIVFLWEPSSQISYGPFLSGILLWNSYFNAEIGYAWWPLKTIGPSIVLFLLYGRFRIRKWGRYNGILPFIKILTGTKSCIFLIFPCISQVPSSIWIYQLDKDTRFSFFSANILRSKGLSLHSQGMLFYFMGIIWDLYFFGLSVCCFRVRPFYY